MKVNFKKATCAAMLLIAAGAVQAQKTSVGTINLEGRITSTTCEIEINGDPNAVNTTVQMGSYPTDQFKNAGDVVGGSGENGKINFKLTKCPADKDQVVLQFSASTVPGEEADMIRLDNPDDSNVAKNIGVYIYDNSDMGTPIYMNDNQYYDIDEDESVELNFTAKYVSYEDSVTAGTANATVNYVIAYN
jgi:major type 1 subunit fimbrin (pilin)